MASTSNNPHVTVEVGEEYPYPSHVNAPNFVTTKLSGRDKYHMWKTQMVHLLKSHDMYGFIDGTLVSPHETSSVSGKEKVGDHHTHNHRLWTRSDALVKGWILGSLSEQALGYVSNRLTENADFTAKDVWDELHTMYSPAVPPQLQTLVFPQVLVSDKENQERRAKLCQRLYELTLAGDWFLVNKFLSGGVVTVIDKITNNGNTALHVAVGTTKNPEFLLNLLGMTPGNTRLSEVRNSDGSTPLHVAAVIGNTEAARILVGTSRDLLLAKDNEGQTPLAIALSNMHTQTSQLLLHEINTDIEKDTLYSGKSGDELLDTVISSKDFGLAYDLVEQYGPRALHSDTVLMALAQNFPCELNTLEKFIGVDFEGIYDFFKSALDYTFSRCVPLCRCVETIVRLFCLGIFGIFGIFVLFPLILQMLVSPFVKKRVQIHDDALNLLRYVCALMKRYKDSNTYHHYYTNPIFEATRQNAYEVVEVIVRYFPNAIWSANEDRHNIIQYAVMSRSEKVYNLLYQMSEHKNVYRTIKDSSGNNLLHLTARLAPTNKLNRISGAALQIQRELQWLKEVERFVCPLNIIQKNSFGETPQMVFTREHKDLVTEGEKWMKSTAESYTITAALITTIVFAAAITVPGGNNQDNGIPIFSNSIAFKLFAISDAISLFTSVTSLLLFLSILTARFAEQDFLFKLPTKLVIGLASLFISTTAMIIAFGATLYLVFGQQNSRILIAIIMLTCLPITCFVTLQFPLVIDLLSSTYGRSIFGKRRDEPFY